MPETLLALLVSPVVGSFLAVVAIRLPAGGSLIRPPSSCDACGRRLRAWELVPLLSFAALRGRCAACKARISRVHPALELGAIAVAIWAALAAPDALWAACALGWTLLALAAADLRTGLLPDALTLPLLLGGLFLAAVENWGAAPVYALGAALGFFVLWLTGAVYARLRGREGLGRGDSKLLAAGGAWVGPLGIAPVLVLAASLGAIHALLLRASGEKLRGTTAIPFGPSLALAIWLTFLYGGGGGFAWF